jgi:hypothetical protein
MKIGRWGRLIVCVIVSQKARGGCSRRVCNFRATVLQKLFFFFSVYSTFFYLNPTSLVWWGLIDFSITKPNQTGSVFNILMGLTDFFSCLSFFNYFFYFIGFFLIPTLILTIRIGF